VWAFPGESRIKGVIEVSFDACHVEADPIQFEAAVVNLSLAPFGAGES